MALPGKLWDVKGDAGEVDTTRRTNFANYIKGAGRRPRCGRSTAARKDTTSFVRYARCC